MVAQSFAVLPLLEPESRIAATLQEVLRKSQHRGRLVKVFGIVSIS